MANVLFTARQFVVDGPHVFSQTSVGNAFLLTIAWIDTGSVVVVVVVVATFLPLLSRRKGYRGRLLLLLSPVAATGCFRLGLFSHAGFDGMQLVLFRRAHIGKPRMFRRLGFFQGGRRRSGLIIISLQGSGIVGSAKLNKFLVGLLRRQIVKRQTTFAVQVDPQVLMKQKVILRGLQQGFRWLVTNGSHGNEELLVGSFAATVVVVVAVAAGRRFRLERLVVLFALFLLVVFSVRLPLFLLLLLPFVGFGRRGLFVAFLLLASSRFLASSFSIVSSIFVVAPAERVILLGMAAAVVIITAAVFSAASITTIHLAIAVVVVVLVALSGAAAATLAVTMTSMPRLLLSVIIIIIIITIPSVTIPQGIFILAIVFTMVSVGFVAIVSRHDNGG
mmetsp:Transcript_19197/g.52742  ORF Transcript_19197/g.52742 Transcript_19197/m.52742 type:complete len:390 (+) Transcript_19197:364-1533(+)